MKFEDVISSVISGQKVALRPDPINFAQDRLTSLAEFGIHFHAYRDLSSKQIDNRFSEVRSWIREVVDSNRLNAVYLDTTTLHTIKELIINKRSPYLNPATLIDLSTFVNSIVLYDNIFHLENEYIDSLAFNEALGNEGVFISLPVRNFGSGDYGDTVHSLGAILRGMWYWTIQYGEEIKDRSKVGRGLYYEDALEIKKAWKLLLGYEGDIKHYFSSSFANKYWASDGPQLLNNLTEANRWLRERLRFEFEVEALDKQISDIISECNYRCLFNLMVGYFLRLYYVPNIFRMPFHRFFYKRAKIVQHYLPSIKYIENEYSKLSELYFAPDENNLTLPFFLSAVLSQISSLDEFFDVLADIRYKASAFRHHRRDLDQAISNGDIKVAKKLHDALQKEGENLRSKFPYVPIAGGIAAVLAALAGATAPIILASIGVLTMVSQFPSEDVEKLKARVLSREYWFLSDMNDVASGLTNAYPKISNLWKIPEDRQEVFAKHFVSLKALRY